MLRYTFLALTFVALAGCGGTQNATAPADTGPALDIRQPPTGVLTVAQLAAVAAEVRRLETRPLAPDADAARRTLFVWVTESPDIHVSLCAGVTRSLVDAGGPYKGVLLTQFILSSAATLIEQPGADATAAHVGGLNGALATYQAIRDARGGRDRRTSLESLATRSQAGTLDAYVREVSADC